MQESEEGNAERRRREGRRVKIRILGAETERLTWQKRPKKKKKNIFLLK